MRLLRFNRCATPRACAALALLPMFTAAAQPLTPATEIIGPSLVFDWPDVEIGIASYEDAPTGVTVIHFPKRVSAVVDVRGGAPGTVNTDALRVGSDAAFVDAVVFAGGSLYGQEAITAVAGGLKQRGQRGTQWGQIAVAVGAIIYDFQDHRLNEIYPDARLGEAALAAARPGVFPLGAQGAGRMATQGDFFGCTAHSGQGGAFRREGAVKLAAFVVVNAGGAVTDRAGNLLRCHRNAAWPDESNVSHLLSRVGTGTLLSKPAPPGPTTNTTVSLILTNVRLNAYQLKRLAIQVHTSMARAIQPFSTEDDGDTLFAASTQEISREPNTLSDAQIDSMAGELMWDAILSSVPEDPDFIPHTPPRLSVQQLNSLVGRYEFGPHAQMQVLVQDGRLMLRSGGPDFFDIPHERNVALIAQSPAAFYIDGRYRTRIEFLLDANGHSQSAVINPGRWAQRGRLLSH